VQRQGDTLCRCAPFRDTRIKIFEPKQNGSRFAGKLICKKNKMIDLIIALRYNKAVKSGIENI